MATKKLAAAVVAYPSTDPESGKKLSFDMDYYLSKHMPLINKAWSPFGMKTWSINQFPNPDPLTGNAPPYLVQTTVYWDTKEDFLKALDGPMKDECAADVWKFSNIWPKIWVGDVVRKEAAEDGLGERQGVV